MTSAALQVDVGDPIVCASVIGGGLDWTQDIAQTADDARARLQLETVEKTAEGLGITVQRRPPAVGEGDRGA